MNELLIFGLKLLFVEIIEVEIALMFLRVTMLIAEYILASTLKSSEPRLLFASPATSLVLLKFANLVKNS